MQLFRRIFRRKRRRTVVLSPAGAHHDLDLIYAQVNSDYFGGKLDVGITWVGRSDVKPLRRITLGSYHLQQQVVRIHRVLDQPHIPPFFVAYIVYHELLHHVYPPRTAGRRREIHHSEFKEKEKLFHHYAEAKTFRQGLKDALFGLSKKT